MSPSSSQICYGTVTRLLYRHRQGDSQALAEAISVIYSNLQQIARRLMAGEKYTPTFDADSLAQEAYLLLMRQERAEWHNRGQLFAIAARIMRRILVDRARGRRYAKRGGGYARTTTLDGKELSIRERGLDVEMLDDALTDLWRQEAELAQVVELRFFGGLKNKEIAEIQGVTTMTIIRRWRLARSWLKNYLSPGGV